jgi:hypothetical protein
MWLLERGGRARGAGALPTTTEPEERPPARKERAVENGLKTPRPMRRKLGGHDEAYFGAPPRHSATRRGPSAN